MAQLILHSHSYIFYGNLRQSRLRKENSYSFCVFTKSFLIQSWHANNIKQEEVFLCLWIVYVLRCCISFTKISPFSPKNRLGESQVKILARILLDFTFLASYVVTTTSHQKLVKTHREYIVQLYTTSTIVQQHPPTKRRTFFILFTLFCGL